MAFYNSQPYLDSGGRLELFGQSGYVVADAHVFQELRSTGGRYSTPSGDILPNIRGVYQTAPIYRETYLTFGADVLGISGSGTAITARNRRCANNVTVDTVGWQSHYCQYGRKI